MKGVIPLPEPPTCSCLSKTFLKTMRDVLEGKAWQKDKKGVTMVRDNGFGGISLRSLEPKNTVYLRRHNCTLVCKFEDKAMVPEITRPMDFFHRDPTPPPLEDHGLHLVSCEISALAAWKKQTALASKSVRWQSVGSRLLVGG